MIRLMIFFFMVCYILGGLVPEQLSPNLSLCSEAFAQADAGEYPQAKNYFARSGIFVFGFAVLWIVFYKLIYPFLLRYYSPAYCKSLFWSAFLLYSMAWLAIGTYVIFEIGFSYEWAKWVFVFMGAVWLIWLLVILLRKDRYAY
jgi:hypothetical protein